MTGLVKDVANLVFLYYIVIIVGSAVLRVVRSTTESAQRDWEGLKARVGWLFGDRAQTDEADPPDPEGDPSETPLADSALAKLRAKRAAAAQAAGPAASAEPAAPRQPIAASIAYGFAVMIGGALGVAARVGWETGEDAYESILERRRERREARAALPEPEESAAPAAQPEPVGDTPPGPTPAVTAPAPVPAPLSTIDPSKPPAIEEAPGSAAPSQPDSDENWLSVWEPVTATPLLAVAPEPTGAPADTHSGDVLPTTTPPPYLHAVYPNHQESLMSAAEIGSIHTLFAWTRNAVRVMEMEHNSAQIAANNAGQAAELATETATRVEHELGSLDLAIGAMEALGLDRNSIAGFVNYREHLAVYHRATKTLAQVCADLADAAGAAAQAAAATQEAADGANKTLHREQDPFVEAAEATQHSSAHGDLYGVEDTRSHTAALTPGL